MDEGGGRRVRSDQWVAQLSDQLCECGCGQRTYVSPKSRAERGYVKGQPRRFVQGHGGRAGRPVMTARAAARRLLAVTLWRGCECGCGVLVRTRFVAGHQARRQYGRPIGPVRVCACGCGQPVLTLAVRWLPSHDKRLAPLDWLEAWSGCWIWQRKANTHGYGSVRVGGRDVLAHRIAYERAHGEGSADGLQIHHRCGEKLCVNPAHLEALTPEEHGRVHGDLARDLWRLRRAA